MDRSILAKTYVPSVYKDFTEMDIIVSRQDYSLDKLEDYTESLLNNQFINTADELGIEFFENILDVIPDKSVETLEFRRERLMGRISLSPPFSMQFLRRKLDETIGVGAWNAYIDFDEFTLYVESSSSDQQWFSELVKIINSTKPANIVFINVPLSLNNLAINENIGYTRNVYNYRLGTTFKLGLSTFWSESSESSVKMSSVDSLKQPLFNVVAGFVETQVNNVLINDAHVINVFQVKTSSNGNVNLTYFVDDTNFAEIRNIKLRDVNNVVLSEASVYVPILGEVSMKHVLSVKERF